MTIHPPGPLGPLSRRLSGQVGDRGASVLRWLEKRGLREPALLTILGAATGLVVGGGILIFYRGIDLAARGIARLVAALPLPVLVVPFSILVLGLAIAHALVRWGVAGSDAESIPDVLEAARRRGGRLHLWPVSIKTAAAAVTLGSGGSVGAEGPVAVLGAALGSRVGRFLRLPPQRLRLLLACGTAAGLSAAFGAPIAGTFFVLEKLLDGFETAALMPVVVASVTAAALTRIGLGSDQVIRIPVDYSTSGGRELLLYGGVAILAGVAGWLYNRVTWKIQDLAARLPMWLRVLTAAVGVTVLASMFQTGLWGRGHATLDLGLAYSVGAGVLFLLCLSKIVATGLTLGGGGVGGVFTPALVIGGTFGAAVGTVLAAAIPSWHLDPIPFGLVGMAAAVGAATHAPLTAVFMVLEMSGDYGLTAPLLIAGPIGYAVAKELYPESIYTEWLARRARAAAAPAAPLPPPAPPLSTPPTADPG